MVPGLAPCPDGSPTSVLIAYHSAGGTTEQLARAVAEGVERVDGVCAVLRQVADVTRDDLVDARGLILGSPTYYANIAGPMKTFIDEWLLRYNVYFGDKVGGAFATGGGVTGGKEHVVVSLLLAMMNNGAIVAGPTDRDGDVQFGYPGASAVDPGPGEPLPESDLDAGRALGERVARVAAQLAG